VKKKPERKKGKELISPEIQNRAGKFLGVSDSFEEMWKGEKKIEK